MYTRSVFWFGFLTACVTCSVTSAQTILVKQARNPQPAWVGSDDAFRRSGGLVDAADRTFGDRNIAREQASRSGIVTLHQLAHKVPARARKEHERGIKAQEKGKHESAIEYLKKATMIDPEYSEALNDLGVSLLHTNRADLAIEQFNRAIAIDPHAAWPYCNLAIAFLMQNKLTDAERAARQQLELERASMRGRLVLGFSLVLQNKFTPEAERNLREAAAGFPQAGLLLAPVLAAKGQIEPAKEQLKVYLASGDRSAVDVANDWMQQLNLASHAKQ